MAIQLTTALPCRVPTGCLLRISLFSLFLGQLLAGGVCGEEGGPASKPATTEKRDQKDYQQDLVLHYTFDQRAGATVLNALGAHHPGTPNRATFAEQKKSGMALTIRQDDVKAGYVGTADHSDFNTQNFTVAAWINLGQSNLNGSVVCKHDWHGGGARGFVLRCYDGKHLNFTVGAGGWLAASGKSTLPAHTWIHVAGAFDGKNITVYFNGQLDGSKTIQAPYKPSSYPLRIGHAAFSLDKHRKFDGKIDDVMIWKRTLAESEIRAVYETQKDARPAPLVAANIARLAAQLGAPEYKRRQQAQQKLLELGRAVGPLLDKYQTTDLEIIVRIKRIKQKLNER